MLIITDADKHRPELLERYKKVWSDPWEFLSTCVYTLDEVDKANPVKPFPQHFPYTKTYVRIWQREPRLIVPKSRRMFMTWTNVGLYVWDTIFGWGRFTVLQSKKEEDSDLLVERAHFIMQNIPDTSLPKELIPKFKKTYCDLHFPSINSSIRGFAQGADQTRQYTISGMLMDEFAFWDNAEDSYSAAIPCLEGGGRVTIISSAGPGFMKRLVYDQLDLEMKQ